MSSVVVFSPAKINLFLAVTGRRIDGYHELVSLVAPLALGDTIWLRRDAARDAIALACNDPTLPTGRDNLAVRAAEAFRRAAGIESGFAIDLRKRIPVGAGLGGGSSNAAAVLRGLNAVCGEPLRPERLSELAAAIGSDCPLFLVGQSCVMRGRGEKIETLPAKVRARLAGLRVLVFKPDFSVSTPWAYHALAERAPAAYTRADAAEAKLAAWLAGEATLKELLFNSFESIVGAKFVALPALLEKVRQQPGVEGALLSGSGSACFALLGPAADAAALAALVRDAWGESAFVAETSLT